MENPIWNDLRAASGGKRPRLKESDREKSLMGHYDSYQALSFRYAPYNPDILLSSKGFKILDDQMTDASVRTSLNILRSALLYKGLRVQAWTPNESEMPPPEAQELADALTYCLNEIEDEYGNCTDPHDIVWELAYGIHVGFRVTEVFSRTFQEGKLKGKNGWSHFSAKPAQQIGFDLDPNSFQVRSLTSYTPAGGYQQDIPLEKVLRWVHDPRNGLPYGTATGRCVYKHSWSKDFLSKFWNLALELFGMPFILAEAPRAAMELAATALRQMRQGAVGVLPEGTKAQLLQVASGGLASYNQAMDYHHQQIVFAYLYNTLTSGTDVKSGARSLGEVHQDTQEYGMARLRFALEWVLNMQLVRRWVVMNYGRAALAYAPKLTLGDWDEADCEKWANAVGTLVDRQVLHPDEPQIRERLKLKPLTPEIKRQWEQEKRENAQNLQQSMNAPGNGNQENRKHAA